MLRNLDFNLYVISEEREREDSFLFGKNIPVAFDKIYTKW